MSILLIKDGDVYAPEHQGEKDILVINEKIFFIDQNILTSALNAMDKNIKIIDASKCMVIPGHIDQHVHINGAGGEGGPQYRTPPIQLSEFVKAGITSVVGLLGTDGFARSLKALLMKARALEQEGISTWIYTGAYEYPSPTITESILSDLILIDKVIGLKIALSDHRASHPTVDEFIKVTSEARAGGILAGKAGVVHIHMGGEKQGLNCLFDIIRNTEIPIEQFAPTHLNKKDEELFRQVVEFGKIGGYIDLTAGVSGEEKSSHSIKPGKAIKELLKNGISIEKITISSDGNGSLPKFNEKKEFVGMSIASVSSLHQEFINMVKEEKFSIKEAIHVTSTNIAKHLKLDKKGEIRVGKDADIIALDKDTLKIKHVIARGKVLMEDEEVVKFGTFEKE
ncbi:MAG: beta-aspartyl-peptidase [bacterium]|uniref:Isoaspartyl dipeptidase n=1 Tax=Candidatus Infernicultor aquiphilus TaxID=1805029 RepID=A0A2M7K818_9BACT|nr:beta-aspartyl-peptidase [bacterium]PIW11258.1 MAG: beta-aspartyl-peptidase [Candidatus Atribacteria bacterium CG17_big_fil_post_rev_8_21_14_2_50_34_11]PIX34277.1 MAG: beta-aspartyl-peptidase [Candidatus Atribacteria bacterium CG_4_8_14_3_um_filter_34_18]PJB55990.1 MAG: beta-aspartyl-peptidase [Candidatus Atribacteria bacterium CG_4_9_14_3_um_filter_33_16]